MDVIDVDLELHRLGAVASGIPFGTPNHLDENTTCKRVRALRRPQVT